METAPFHEDLAEGPSGARAFWLKASDGKRLRAVVWPGGDRGAALLFSGRSEYSEKYGRVAKRLTDMGFSVATLDWRGQGLSDRPASGTGLGHVLDFAEYQRDIDAFLAAAPVAALPGRKLLLCHSMGGCIGLRALIDGRVKPAAAVFSAPMWGMKLSPAMRPVARIMTFLGAAFGLGERHAPGGIGEKFYVLSESFDKNLLTNDPEYWDWFGAHLRAHPELGLGAPSFAWARAAFRETEALAKAPPPKTPALVLLGGEEKIVDPAAIHAQVARTPSAALCEIPGGKHEMLMEDFAGPIGAQVWSSVDAFLSERGL
jgi:lysophospholipase